MTVYRWNPLLAPRGVNFSRRGMTVGGPPTLTGRNQVGQLDAGYWVASFTRVAVGPAATVLAFEALKAQLEGGAHQVLVPAYEDDRAPWPAAGGRAANAYAEQPYSDGTLHSDGHGFFRPSIVVTLAADAALRATSISVTVTTAGAIAAGNKFSIGDRLYTIKEVTAVSGSAQTWSIAPPLREAATSGTGLNFENPVCRMRLANEAEMDLALERGIYGFSDIAFIEVP